MINMPVSEKECFWRKKQLWKKALKIWETKKKRLEVEWEIGVIMFKLGRIIKLRTHRWWLGCLSTSRSRWYLNRTKLMQTWFVFGLWVLAMYIIPTYSSRALSTSEIVFVVQWKSFHWTDQIKTAVISVWFKIWCANKEKYKVFQYDIASLVTPDISRTS